MPRSRAYKHGYLTQDPRRNDGDLEAHTARSGCSLLGKRAGGFCQCDVRVQQKLTRRPSDPNKFGWCRVCGLDVK
jgi:hypothetical protein